ncbi:hypothetical protein U1Q18_040698 [Sarracenia purpurea var. burkii]
MGDCGATQGENRCINSGIDVDEGNGEVEGNTPNSGCLVSRDSRENEDCAADFGLCSKMRAEPPYQTGNLDYVLKLNDFAVDVNGVEKGVMPLGSETQNANKPEKVCDAHNLFDNLSKQTLSETKEGISFAPSDEVSLSLGSEFVPMAGIKVRSERKCDEGSVVAGGVIVDDNPTGQNMKQGGLGERAHSAHHMFDKMTMLEETPKLGPEEGTENVEVERDPILNEKGVSVSEVVTGEGTENEVSLVPSLLFNCDSDSVVAVDEGADVMLSGALFGEALWFEAQVALVLSKVEDGWKEESSIQSVSSDCKANIDGGAKADDENVDLNVNKGDEAIGGLEKTKLNDPRLLEMMSGNKSHSSESATVCVNGEEDDGAHIPWACLQGVRGRWVFEVRWEQGTLWICPQGS